jgi:uncharacterized protein
MTSYFDATNTSGRENPTTYTAFAGTRTLARGYLEEVIRTTKECLDAESELRVVILDDSTSRQVDFDFDGSEDDVVARAHAFVDCATNVIAAPASARETVGGEIALLPRHWEWLRRQPGSVSVTLGRLIDEADSPEQERAHTARAATGRLMWAMASDLPDAEQASRALLDADDGAFRELAKRLPPELREHLEVLLRDRDSTAVPDSR